MPLTTEQKREMQIWTREEFDQFINAVDDPMYRALFGMMFYTGRRKGEIFALGSDDVGDDEIIFNKTHTRRTLDNNRYKITAMKNRNGGKTPICEPLKEILRGYTPDNLESGF